MPEGDSLYRLASRLAPVLEGREVTSFAARRLPDAAARTLVGHRISKVYAKGKNLLIGFDDGRLLHIHLKMDGRVFVERPRSAFWAPERYGPDMRLVVDGASIVGRRLPVLRLLTEAQAKRSPDLAGLGPDLVREGYDEAEAVKRLRALTDRDIADALLVQRAAAGIGNVYKSEVLFLEGIHPRTPISLVTDDELRALLRRASVLLRRNLGDGPRTTRPTLGGARLWVYGRGGRPCLRCSTPIVRFMQGPDPGRSTYFCPNCQPERTAERHGEARP
jgi:endonuclease VIII